MLLSVVVPVYNVREYLSDCVASLQASSCDYEVLLVDDGSTDESGEMCDAFAASDPHIRVIHKENGGLSDARNAGLLQARGEYVMFVDSDDYLEEGSLLRILDAVSAGECDVYCTDFYSLCDGVRADIRYTPTDEVMSGVAFLKLQHKNRSMVSSVVQNIYRTDLLREGELYFKKGIYHEDEEWYPRVFLKAERVVYLPFVYYVYRIRAGSIMQKRDLSKHICDFIETVRALLVLFAAQGDRELYALMKDSLVDKYLSIYARGDFGKGRRELVLPRRYLWGELVHGKTKKKLLVFSVSRRLFCRMSREYHGRRK